MASKKLTRTTYINPITTLIRTGETTRAESRHVDTTQYNALEQVHGSVSRLGVAAGLRITATLGQQNVNVEAGIALDSSGRRTSPWPKEARPRSSQRRCSPGVSP